MKKDRGQRAPGAKSDRDHIFMFDEIAVEMDRFAHSREVTLMLMISAQIFLDINHIMGKEADRGIKALKSYAETMVQTMQRRDKVEGNIVSESWTSVQEFSIQHIRSKLEWWNELDPYITVAKGGAYSLKDDDVKGVSLQKLHFANLLPRNPLFCGFHMFAIRLAMRRHGLNLIDGWGSGQAMAHLYIACQQPHIEAGASDQISIEWKDMDLFIELHGKIELFDGNIPNGVMDSYENYMTMIGLSEEYQDAYAEIGPESYDYKKLFRTMLDKGSIKKEAENGRYGLRDRSEIAKIFHYKTLTDETHLDHVDISGVERLLKKLKREEEISIKLSKDNNNELDSEKSKKPIKNRRPRKHKSSKFSIVQLLSVLEQGLINETSAILFDYVSFHITCLEILERLKVANNQQITLHHGPEYIQSKIQLPFTVGVILQIAVYHVRHGRTLAVGIPGDEARTKRDLESQSDVLENSAIKVNEMLDNMKEGRIEVDKIRSSIST